MWKGSLDTLFSMLGLNEEMLVLKRRFRCAGEFQNSAEWRMGSAIKPMA